jgi:hypothetical protein
MLNIVSFAYLYKQLAVVSMIVVLMRTPLQGGLVYDETYTMYGACTVAFAPPEKRPEIQST